MKTEVISVRIEESHKELFQKFMPHFGSCEGEVMRNLALRWIETNLTNPNVIDMSKRGLIQLKISKRK
jgi:hypothetical protein